MYSIAWSLGLHHVCIGGETSDITSFSRQKERDDQVIRYEDLRSASKETRIPYYSLMYAVRGMWHDFCGR